MEKYLLIILITLCLNSCVVSHTVTLTNNPVGSEKFRLTTNDLSTNVGLSIVEAKKLSGITEISILEYKKINYFFANVEHITITGSTTKSEKHEKNKE